MRGPGFKGARVWTGLTISAMALATGLATAATSQAATTPAPEVAQSVHTTAAATVATIQDKTGKTGAPMTSPVSGPAPEWFRDPNFQPAEPMPAPSASSSLKSPTGTVLPREVFVAMPYCRDVYGHYYWMSSSDNPASCTQGYVKFYDSRNSSYLGAIDVYMLYWNMTPSTAVSTAYGWCTSNFVCSNLLGALVVSKIGAAWNLIRAIRWAL